MYKKLLFSLVSFVGTAKGLQYTAFVFFVGAIAVTEEKVVLWWLLIGVNLFGALVHIAGQIYLYTGSNMKLALILLFLYPVSINGFLIFLHFVE